MIRITILLLGTGCGSFAGNDSTANEKFFEGWAGPPEDMEKKPYKYFYTRRVNRASPKSVEKQDPVRMRETCTSGAALTAKADFMRKMIGEEFMVICQIEDRDDDIPKIIVAEYNNKVKGIKTRECRPLKEAKSEIPGMEWEECECLWYAKVPGGKEAIKARIAELENRK